MTVRIGLVATIGLCPACQSERVARSRPNVVIITLDTTRWDRLGCTGDPTAHTPNIDALAARGVLFDRAYAATALTLPSHTTIMTGLEPPAHGVHANGHFRASSSLTTLAERLSVAGWYTGAFVSAFVLDASYNLDQGFDVYGDETKTIQNRLEFAIPERPADAVTDEATAWLAHADVGRPFFLWAHYYDPHMPWEAPAPFDEIDDGYAAEIAFADAEIGRLLAAERRW